MKLLILTNQPYPNMIGGSAKKLTGECKYLDKNNHEVNIISSRGGDKKLRDHDAICYANIKQVGLPYIPLGKARGFKLIFKLNLWIIVNFIYFWAALFRGIKIANSVDTISIKGVHSDGLCGVILKKIFKKRLVYEHAGGLNIKRAKLFKHKKRGALFLKIGLWFNTFTERIVYRNCDAIMTQESMEDYYRDLGFKGDYYVIPNGRDADEFHPFGDINVYLKKDMDISGKVILFVGRFDPVKNVDKIIDAFSLIKEKVHLVIVGGGDLGPELMKHAEESLGSKNIHFMGSKPDVTPYYMMADALVIASTYEGFPGVLIEGMASELAVVSTPVGTVPKVIKDGENGYLIPKKWKTSDLTIGMIKAINAPDKLRENARLTFEENYSWDVVIKKFIQVYSS